MSDQSRKSDLALVLVSALRGGMSSLAPELGEYDRKKVHMLPPNLRHLSGFVHDPVLEKPTATASRPLTSSAVTVLVDLTAKMICVYSA